ncbi:unnamed protein product, partial [Agarophyton chilense]
GYYPPLQDE